MFYAQDYIKMKDSQNKQKPKKKPKQKKSNPRKPNSLMHQSNPELLQRTFEEEENIKFRRIISQCKKRFDQTISFTESFKSADSQPSFLLKGRKKNKNGQSKGGVVVKRVPKHEKKMSRSSKSKSREKSRGNSLNRSEKSKSKKRIKIKETEEQRGQKIKIKLFEQKQKKKQIKEQYNGKQLERYLHSFNQANKFEIQFQERIQSGDQIESFRRDEERKWEQIKSILQKMKKNKNANRQFNTLILQVESNLSTLKKMDNFQIKFASQKPPNQLYDFDVPEEEKKIEDDESSSRSVIVMNNFSSNSSSSNQVQNQTNNQSEEIYRETPIQIIKAFQRQTKQKQLFPQQSKQELNFLAKEENSANKNQCLQTVLMQEQQKGQITEQQNLPLFCQRDRSLLRDETVEHYFVSFLVEEMILQLTSKMRKYFLTYLFGLFSDEDSKKIIRHSNEEVIFMVHMMLEFMIKLPNKTFQNRLAHPLGLKTADLLNMLRHFRYGTEKQSPILNRQQEFISIISIDHRTKFEIENYVQDSESDSNDLQQFFNLAIFDAMNQILNQVRIFGKQGYPPICFKDTFTPPTYHKVYKKVMAGMKNILSYKMGRLYEDEIGEISRNERRMLGSWTEEYDESMNLLREDKFEICLELMFEIEQIVILQEIYNLGKLFKII